MIGKSMPGVRRGRYLRERSENETGRIRPKDASRVVSRCFESETVVDVVGDGPQLFTALESFLAHIGEIDKPAPIASLAETVDRAQERVEVGGLYEFCEIRHCLS
jgi:hypothetical protein